MEPSTATESTIPRLELAPDGALTEGDFVLSGNPRRAKRARERSSVLSRSLAFSDLVVSILACGLMGLATGLSPGGTVALAASAGILYPLCMFVLGIYAVDELRAWASGVSEAPKGIVGALVFSWPLYGAAALAGAPSPFGTTVGAVVATLVAGAASRSAVRGALHRSDPLRQRTVIVGSGLVAGQLVDKLTLHEQFGLVPVGLVDDEPHPGGVARIPLLGGLGDLPEILSQGLADRVIIAFSRASHQELLSCIRTCGEYEVSVDIVPRLFEFVGGARSLDTVGGLPLLSLGMPRLTRSSRVAKRALDLAAAALLLVALLPLMLIIAVVIRIESRGPVFFRQPRVGRSGRTFSMIKFRSMCANADQRKDDHSSLNDLHDGVMFKIRLDPRVTRVGRWLRRSSLDELPQLWNVLRGEMSLVGPRPLIHEESDALAEDWHARRLDLRPGITGAWQVQGRSESPFQEMVRLDYQYVAGWSLARDIEILLATVPAVMSGRGAY